MRQRILIGFVLLLIQDLVIDYHLICDYFSRLIYAWINTVDLVCGVH